MSSTIAVLIKIAIVMGVLVTLSESRAATRPADPSVARCRTKCIYKLLDHLLQTEDAFEKCAQNPDCYMCWDYCSAVKLAPPQLASDMCGDEEFCSAGCMAACQFHKVDTVQRILTRIVQNQV